MIYVNTGDLTLDDMIFAIAENSDADTAELCICAAGEAIPSDASRVIVIYEGSDYPSGEAFSTLTEEYGRHFACSRSPISVRELEEAIRTVCTSVGHIGSTSELRYDKTRSTVSKNGVTTHLSAKEQQLFEILWKNKGSVVSRDTLRKKLWQGTDGTNAPDVYVSYLRRKLDPVMGKGSLVSIRGRGYMLKDE